MTFDVKQFDTEKFDYIIARGLSYGLGIQGQQVCIEAAICETLGLPHSDDPKCVAYAVRSFKISLNDSKWSTPQARAQGMRDLGLAQLGSLGVVSDTEFAKRMAEKTIRFLIPKLFRELFAGNEVLQQAADRCEKEGSYAAAYAAGDAAGAAARAAAYAARAAAYAARAARDAAGDAAGDAARAAGDAAWAAAGDAARAARDAARAAAYADSYLILAAQLALDTLRELNSPGIALL